MARSVLFVTDSDSNVKFATSFGRHLESAGLETKVVFVGQGLASLTQAANAVQEGVKVDVAPSFDVLFAGRELLRYDVIFVLITGRTIREFCSNLNLLALTYGVAKPVTIGGFIGEWISANGQVEERGALDIFVVNRADELEKFREICARASHGKTFKALPYGFLVRHGFAKPLAPTFDYDLNKTVVFADQVQVPRSDGERSFLYENIEAIARKAPNLKLVFCTREIPGGATNHRSLGGIGDYLGPQRLAALPNVTVEHGTFQKRLAEADVVLSVSSTAGVEALINGVPALFLRGFASSGAEKFAHTGLLIDIFELKAPKTFRIDPAFHADMSRMDVWDEFAALVRAQPDRGVDARPAKRVVRTSLLATPAPAGKYEELVYDVLGFDEVEELDARVNAAPLDLRAGVEAARSAPAGYAATIGVSDAPRLASSVAAPTFVATRLDGYVATADLPVAGTELAVHLPFAFGAGDMFEIAGSAHGEALKIVCTRTGPEIRFSDATAIQVMRAAYKVGAEVISVFRLRSFAPLDLKTVRVTRAAGSVPPSWIAWEASYGYTRLGRVGPTLEPEAGTIPAHDRSGQMTAFRFDREVAGHVGPLFTLTAADGATLAVSGLTGARLGLTLTVGNQVIVKEAPLSVLSVRMVVISTPSMTIVMLNENLSAFEAPFRPATLSVNPGLRGGFIVNLFAAFAADISLTKANTLVEQILLRFFSSPAYAKKHREIPDFRTAIETRLGKPAPAAAPVVVTPTAKAPGKGAALNGAAGKPGPVAKPAAKPVVKLPTTLPDPAEAAPIAVRPARPVVKAPATEQPAVAASTSDMSGVVSTYLDVVTAGDLAAAVDVAKGHNSPLAFSERFMREGQYGKALALSAIAADRTPTSKAHMMICAQALAELGAPDRAEAFLKKAELLAPGDPAVRARAAAIRAKQNGAPAHGGVAGFLRRALGGR